MPKGQSGEQQSKLRLPSGKRVQPTQVSNAEAMTWSNRYTYFPALSHAPRWKKRQLMPQHNFFQATVNKSRSESKCLYADDSPTMHDTLMTRCCDDDGLNTCSPCVAAPHPPLTPRGRPKTAAAATATTTTTAAVSTQTPTQILPLPLPVHLFLHPP